MPQNSCQHITIYNSIYIYIQREREREREREGGREIPTPRNTSDSRVQPQEEDTTGASPPSVLLLTANNVLSFQTLEFASVLAAIRVPYDAYQRANTYPVLVNTLSASSNLGAAASSSAC